MLVHSTGATSWNKSLGRWPFFNPVLAPSAFWRGVIFVYTIYFVYTNFLPTVAVEECNNLDGVSRRTVIFNLLLALGC